MTAPSPPNITSTGSPGVKYMSENTMNVTPMMTGMSCSKR